MFHHLWSRLARLWRPLPCERCGAPAVGFAAELSGKLPTRDKDGKPITKMYVRGVERVCKRCLEESQGR